MHGAGVAGALPQGRVQVMGGVAGYPPQEQVNDVPPEGGIYIGVRQRM